MARRIIDFNEVDDCVLVFLEKGYYDDTNFYIKFVDIRNGLAWLPANAIKDSLADLQPMLVTQKTEVRKELSFGVPQQTDKRVAVDGYRITKQGLERVKRLSDDRYGHIEGKFAVASKIEEPEDSWSPLPIERESQAYTQALEASEAAGAALE